MNRVLPETVSDSYFAGWQTSQKRYMQTAEDYFSPVPIFPVRLFQNEVLGFRSLQELAEQIYPGQNPLARFFEGAPYQIRKSNGDYRLTLQLPFILKGDLQLNRVSDELIIQVGNYKRHLLLPRPVAAARYVKARLDGRQLKIDFKGGKNGQREK
jgi:arsenite-transporting ATPase